MTPAHVLTDFFSSVAKRNYIVILVQSLEEPVSDEVDWLLRRRLHEGGGRQGGLGFAFDYVELILATNRS